MSGSSSPRGICSGAFRRSSSSFTMCLAFDCSLGIERRLQESVQFVGTFGSTAFRRTSSICMVCCVVDWPTASGRRPHVGCAASLTDGRVSGLRSYVGAYLVLGTKDTLRSCFCSGWNCDSSSIQFTLCCSGDAWHAFARCPTTPHLKQVRVSPFLIAGLAPDSFFVCVCIWRGFLRPPPP